MSVSTFNFLFTSSSIYVDINLIIEPIIIPLATPLISGTNMSETDAKERQIIIDRLEKEIEDPNARNFLDTISLKLLKVITPTESRTMLDKFFIKNKPPTQTHTPTISKHKY